MDRPGWPEAFVAVAFLALLGFSLWLAVENATDFETAWAVAGPLVGIVIGAIPSYFFRVQAGGAELRARRAERRLVSLLQFASDTATREARAHDPSAWLA